MKRNCQHCTQPFTIDGNDLAFYQKIAVPPPTFCWRCRMQRRMSWRNERSLYKSRCAKTKKEIITIFAPDAGITVWDRDEWWKDDWNPLTYGDAYDWQKPFFQQFQELYRRVPHPAVFNSKCQNSTYCNHVGELKDCYLVFASWEGEKLAYCAQEWGCRDSFDLLGVGNSELCIECVNSEKLYQCAFVQNSENCHHSLFLFECRGCSFCFGCTNLRNKTYCIFNEQYSEAEYFAKLKEMNLGSYQGIEAAWLQFQSLKLKSIHRYASIFNSENCTGDNITYGKNCQNCFGIKKNTVDCKFCINGGEMTDSYDGYGVGAHSSLQYEMVDSGVNGSRQKFGLVVWGCTDVEYCYNCHNCKDCFGCTGLRGAQYCILNRQYSKKEYAVLVSKIIAHMNTMPFVGKKGRRYTYGEFFPMELSPFFYNETVAQEYFTLTKEEVTAAGLRWRDEETHDEQKQEAATEIIDSPPTVDSTPGDIVEKILRCAHQGTCNEQCTKLYKMLQEELALYKKMNIALPTLCPNCRHYQRLRQRPPFTLWHRQCLCEHRDHGHAKKCPTEFETPYAPARKEIIYCEECYQKEVY